MEPAGERRLCREREGGEPVLSQFFNFKISHFYSTFSISRSAISVTISILLFQFPGEPVLRRQQRLRSPRVVRGVVPPAGEQGQLLGEHHALSVNNVRFLGNLSITALNLIPRRSSFKLRLQTGC